MVNWQAQQVVLAKRCRGESGKEFETNVAALNTPEVGLTG